MAEQTIPTDNFSRRRRELTDHPGVIRSASTVNLSDFYGNLETWVIETFRAPGAAVEVLIQRTSVDGGLRLVLPALVMATIDRQLGQTVAVSRRRGARQAVETRRARGDSLGNPDALRKARRGRKAAK